MLSWWSIAHAAVTPSCWVGEPGVMVGGVPLEVTCEAVGAGTGTLDATWEVDGELERGETVAFTLDAEGLYGIEGCTSTTDPDCAEVCTTFEILACDPPEALILAEGSGRTWTLADGAPEDTPGCVTQVQWEVLDADGALVEQSRSLEPTVVLPDDGTYLVTLSVRGPGGEATDQLELSTGGCGCASAPGLGGWLALFPALAVLRR